MEALEPLKVPNMEQEPEPFPYLKHENSCNFNLQLEVDIKSNLSDFFSGNKLKIFNNLLK